MVEQKFMVDSWCYRGTDSGSFGATVRVCICALLLAVYPLYIANGQRVVDKNILKDNTMENVDYRAEMERILAGLNEMSDLNTGEALELMEEGMYCSILLAEENLREQRNYGQMGVLALRVLEYGTHLEGFDHMLNAVQNATNRMVEALYDHPRLKLKLLYLRQTALMRIEAIEGHDLSILEDLREDIAQLRSNIEYADKGEFDKIVNEGMLKKDPVEWSARYEEVIDEAELLIDKMVADHPRGMGFCFAYWHAKAEVLSSKFGIEWRSPSVMNPRVMFD